MKKDYTNNEVIHIKNGEVEYLKFNALKEFENKIECIVTLRHGGISEGVYNSLNFRTAGLDKKENVLKNLNIICNKINIDVDGVCKGTQAHTDNILVLDENNMNEYEFELCNSEEVDGYITTSNKLTTIITTADCNAIVIYDPVRNVVANLHSGWKGTVKKIYLKAIDKMEKEFNSNINDLIVCVSPAVLDCCFSSEEEQFKKIFTDVWEEESEYIYYEKENPKRFHISLPYVITKDLIKIGIKKENIHFSNICTCCNEEDFYSYRKRTQRKDIDYGVMATIVKLR